MLVLLVIPFAFFGLESYTRLSGGRDDVATVNGITSRTALSPVFLTPVPLVLWSCTTKPPSWRSRTVQCLREASGSLTTSARRGCGP